MLGLITVLSRTGCRGAEMKVLIATVRTKVGIWHGLYDNHRKSTRRPWVRVKGSEIELSWGWSTSESLINEFRARGR